MTQLPRRALLQSAAALLGASVGGVLGQACVEQRALRVPQFTPGLLKREQALLVEDLSELILPAGDTPGALEAGVPAFIESLLCDVFAEPDRAAFIEGIDQLDEQARQRHGQPFSGCARAEQMLLLEQLAATARVAQSTALESPAMESTVDSRSAAFFTKFRELVITGYCNSELGATRLLHYQGVPGRYQGCVPLKSVGRTWAIE